MNKISVASLVTVGSFFIGSMACAQERTTVEAFGADKKGRAPNVTVSWGVDSTIEGSPITLLADANVESGSYKDKPIAFEFYINGELLKKQIRTPELPRPVGVVLNSVDYVPPFNATVRATVIDANREFNTLAQIAVFSSKYAATGFDCTVTIDSADGELSDSFTANEVSTTQGGENLFSVAFSGTQLDVEATADVSADFTVVEEKISGVIVVTRDDVPASYTVNEGTVTITENAITAFDGTSADGLVNLSCTR